MITLPEMHLPLAFLPSLSYDNTSQINCLYSNACLGVCLWEMHSKTMLILLTPRDFISSIQQIYHLALNPYLSSPYYLHGLRIWWQVEPVVTNDDKVMSVYTRGVQGAKSPSSSSSVCFERIREVYQESDISPEAWTMRRAGNRGGRTGNLAVR